MNSKLEILCPASCKYLNISAQRCFLRTVVAMVVVEGCSIMVKDCLGVSVLQERSLKPKVRLTLGDVMWFQSV
jgi:hypothetical protein